MGISDAIHQACGVCVLFLCGVFVFFPGGVVLTAWNEHRSVCRVWAIESAEKEVNILDCGQHTTAVPGTLGFLACPVDQSTFTNYTYSNSFAGITNLKDVFGVGGAGQAAAALTMTVQQWQCKETCVEEQCRRRLGEQSTKEPADKARSLLNKHEALGEDVKARNLKSKGKSCTNVCVRYSHEKILSAETPTTSFQRPGEAITACGAGATTLRAPSVQGHDLHAPGGQIATANGHAWTMNENQVQLLPINVPVPLTPRAAVGSFTDSPSASQLTEKNTYVIGNTIHTCQSPGMGCYEISFTKSVPTRMAMLGAVSTVPGEMAPLGWNGDGFWLCKGSSTNNINRFCPSHSSIDTNKGVLPSCGEDVTQVTQMFTALKNASWYAQWGYRIGGFVMLFMAFSCCFLPLKACLGFITDMIDDGTECIPCVGSCVDCLTDIFMKIVSAILGVVSFCCACGTFLIVCAFMWMVLKPWYGIPMMIGACCFCGGAGGLLYYFRGGKGDGSEALSEEEMSDYEQDN